MMTMKPQEAGDVFTYANSGAEDLVVCVEPWIAEIRVPAGSHLKVFGWSDQPGQFDWDDSACVLYAWAGASAAAEVNGLRVWETDIACPGLPQGVSMRRFFGTLGWSEDAS